MDDRQALRIKIHRFIRSSSKRLSDDDEVHILMGWGHWICVLDGGRCPKNRSPQGRKEVFGPDLTATLRDSIHWTLWLGVPIVHLLQESSVALLHSSHPRLCLLLLLLLSMEWGIGSYGRKLRRDSARLKAMTAIKRDLITTVRLLFLGQLQCQLLTVCVGPSLFISPIKQQQHVSSGLVHGPIMFNRNNS